MRNKQSGQALVEFVLILPVFVLLVFSFIDLGRIIVENNKIESITSNVIEVYKEENNYEDITKYLKDAGYSDYEVNISKSEDYLKVKVTKNIDIITPGLNRIFSNPYKVSAERMVNNEQ